MAVKKKTMYTGDLKPDYRAELSDTLPDGTTDTTFDLTVATSVRVVGKIKLAGEKEFVPLFDRAGNIAGNAVVMEWQVDDTKRVGIVETEVEVMWPGNKPQTFRPPEQIQLVQDYGGAATSGTVTP